jgi:hypothetical protein
VSFIDAADVRAQSALTVSATDEELSPFIDAACQVVEDLCGPIETRTVTAEVVLADSTNLIFDQTPVLSVTSLALVRGGVSYSPVLFTLNAETGIAYLADGSSLPGQFVATYQAGYATVPVWAKVAATIIAAHLATSRRASATRTGVPNDTTPVSGYLIPNQAMEMLRSHLNLPGFA